jgi:hypothetical protein
VGTIIFSSLFGVLRILLLYGGLRHFWEYSTPTRQARLVKELALYGEHPTNLPYTNTSVASTSPMHALREQLQEKHILAYSTSFDIERVCRLLVHFALYTEELDHEKAPAV